MPQLSSLANFPLYNMLSEQMCSLLSARRLFQGINFQCDGTGSSAFVPGGWVESRGLVSVEESMHGLFEDSGEEQVDQQRAKCAHHCSGDNIKRIVHADGDT